MGLTSVVVFLTVFFGPSLGAQEDFQVCSRRLLSQANTKHWNDKPPVVQVEWGYDGMVSIH